MRHYEIVIIVHPNQSAKMPDILGKYQEMIIENGGKVHRLEDWGRQMLAYPINKVYKGHYALMNIECPKSVLNKLNYNFRFNDIIIRNLVITKKRAITKKSIMMSKKEKQNKQEE